MMKKHPNHVSQEEIDDETSENQTDDQLLSGFLTALNMFAENQQGDAIRELTMNNSIFMFERADDLVFVINSGDKEAIPIIKKLLEQVKERFYELFPEAATEIPSDLTKYNPFFSILDEILQNFHIYELIEKSSVFKEHPSMKGLLELDRIRGDFLYVRAKEFLDRNILGFQSEIIVKSSLRMMKDLFNEELKEIGAISSRQRGFRFFISPQTILIEEFHTENPEMQILNLPSDKSIEKRMKSSGKLLFEGPKQFMIIDHQGIARISNIAKNITQGKQIGVDIFPIGRGISIILEKIYKDALNCLIFIGSTRFILMIPLGELTAMISYENENLPNLTGILEFTLQFRRISEDRSDSFCIFDEINKFIQLFS